MPSGRPYENYTIAAVCLIAYPTNPLYRFKAETNDPTMSTNIVGRQCDPTGVKGIEWEMNYFIHWYLFVVIAKCHTLLAVGCVGYWATLADLVCHCPLVCSGRWSELRTIMCWVTRSSVIAEGPRDASCQLKSCQLPRNSEVRQVQNKSKSWSWRAKVGRCVVNMCTQPWRVRVAFIVL